MRDFYDLSPIEQIENTVGFSIQEVLSKRGQERVIEEHKIDKYDLTKFCLINMLEPFEESKTKRYELGISFLNEKYPNNIIIKDLLYGARLGKLTKEEENSYKKELIRFQNMYQTESIKDELLNTMIEAQVQYKRGQIQFDEFSKIVSLFQDEASNVFKEASKIYEEKFVKTFRENDIEILPKEETKEALEDEEEEEI